MVEQTAHLTAKERRGAYPTFPFNGTPWEPKDLFS
jgi:hypothetical protein